MMLKYLKEETQSIHSAVEKTNLAKYVLDHSISLLSYKELLVKNYCSYSIIENELIDKKNLIRPNLRQFINADKSNALRKDLKELHILPENNAKNNSRFSIDSEAEAIGAMYVMEGSMLGGMLINRHLKDCVHLKEIKEHHFFEATDPRRWKSFTQIINQTYFGLDEKKQALNKARKAFHLFG